jgi:IS605 OrfB family transposase
MKINRSVKCSLRFLTKQKSDQLSLILAEYGKVANFFIDYFWENPTLDKRDLLKPIVNLPQTELSARLRKTSARESLDLISSVKNVFDSNKEQLLNNIKSIESTINKIEPTNKKNRRKINNLHVKLKKLRNKHSMLENPTKPKHSGKRMCVSSTIAELQECKDTDEFDAWLHLSSIGNKISLNLPIKFHKQFNKLVAKGQRLNSYIITKDYVQFVFEVDTGTKKPVNKIIGIDSGINALASTSDRKQFGKDIKGSVERVKRCKKGSKGKQRAIRALKQRIDEVAKEVLVGQDLIVVEKLSNLNQGSKLKGRLSKNIRSSIGSWNYSYWLMRLEEQCENNRVSFRTVNPHYTSQRCVQCGYTDSKNRLGTVFICQRCGHVDNADINAAINIRERFLAGKYGSCYKPLIQNELPKFT